MSEITKEDLKETENNILKSLEPFTKEINGIKLTLYGPDGRAGVVGDVNNIKTSAKLFKGIAIGGLMTGVSSWVKEFFK